MSPIISFVLTIAAVTLYAVLHSVMAHPSIKKLAEDWLGWAYDRYYRLIFNTVGVITLLPVLAIPARFPGITIYRITAPLVWITAALQLGALLVIAIGLLQTDPLRFLGLRQLAVGSAHSQSNDLTTSGLYRWVRHPLYTGGMLFIWLTPVMTTSVLALNLGFTAYLYIGSMLEEERLIDRFGEDYLEYQDRVPRFFPRFSDLYEGPAASSSDRR